MEKDLYTYKIVEKRYTASFFCILYFYICSLISY